MDKIIGMVRNNPELRKQLEAETERLVKEKEAAGSAEALIRAAKTVLDIEIAAEELERLDAGSRDLDLDELEQAGGGKTAGKKNTGGSQWELFWNTVFKVGTQGL